MTNHRCLSVAATVHRGSSSNWKAGFSHSLSPSHKKSSCSKKGKVIFLCAVSYHFGAVSLIIILLGQVNSGPHLAPFISQEGKRDIPSRHVMPRNKNTLSSSVQQLLQLRRSFRFAGLNFDAAHISPSAPHRNSTAAQPPSQFNWIVILRDENLMQALKWRPSKIQRGFQNS